MANEIYHKSNWGSPEKDGWGDSYFNPSATNKLYTRSDNYENSDGTDKALDKKPDTQSILMTPTAYDVGSMNSVLPPYEVLPTELVTNGDFATDSDWIKGTGTTISGGNANFVNATAVSLYQNIGTQEGSVKVVFNVTNYTSGTLNVYSGGNQSAGVINVSANALGTYTVDVIRTGGNNNIIFGSTSGFTGSIDNVSVKEVRNADFTFDRSSTATRVNKEGLIETVAIDTPRLDYPLIDGVVQDCPSLLLEPAATNLVTQSEDFSNAAWVKLGAGTGSAAIVTSDYAISPDGTQNATRLQCDLNGGTSSGDQSLIYFIPSGSSNTYTNSFYVKGVSGQTFAIGRDLVNRKTILTDGTWQRVDFSYNNTPITFIGLRGTTGSDDILDIEIYGAQVEAGSYATSYIPTSGSTVTRSAETANGAGTSAEFNDSEGVLYAECAFINDRGTSSPFQVQRISLSDGTDTNRIFIGNTITSNQIQVFVRNSTGISFNKTVTINDIKQQNKISLKYKANDYALWINGFELETDTTYDYLPSGLDELKFEGAAAYSFLGKTKEVAVFKEALTDSELEALTSWDSFNDMAIGQEYSIR